MVKREMMSSNLKSFVLDIVGPHMSLCEFPRAAAQYTVYVYRMFSLKKKKVAGTHCWVHVQSSQVRLILYYREPFDQEVYFLVFHFVIRMFVLLCVASQKWCEMINRIKMKFVFKKRRKGHKFWLLWNTLLKMCLFLSSTRKENQTFIFCRN